jgi:hypothetical protein
VVHRARFLQEVHHLRHLAGLLPDGHVNADQVAALLVDNCVERDLRLAREHRR